MSSGWYKPHGSLVHADGPMSITAEEAGWAYSGLTVIDRDCSMDLTGPGEDSREAVILPLSAQGATLTVTSPSGQATTYTLQGREGVFAAVSDWVYAGRGSRLDFSGVHGEIAILTAKARADHPTVYTAAADVPVEVRGGGRATRQVTNIATPDSFSGADRICVCEVITPGGNWSSWPPHRHDGIGDCPTTNEEIYYFRIGKQDSLHGDPEGTGLFRVYTVDGGVDETVTIWDADTYLVPEGYHGPTAAAPDYPMYFLNVLAGPGEDRTMAFCDDPNHHWIRGTWSDTDPRLPMTSAEGRIR
ncbi:MAG: 5-deoxy-glucuronate isomerase [Candidatus Nanopelagicales bacterium]